MIGQRIFLEWNQHLRVISDYLFNEQVSRSFLLWLSTYISMTYVIYSLCARKRI